MAGIQNQSPPASLYEALRAGPPVVPVAGPPVAGVAEPLVVSEAEPEATGWEEYQMLEAPVLPVFFVI